MNIKGFRAKDGTVYQYDYDALANKPEIPAGPGSGGNVDLTIEGETLVIAENSTATIENETLIL